MLYFHYREKLESFLGLEPGRAILFFIKYTLTIFFNKWSDSTFLFEIALVLHFLVAPLPEKNVLMKIVSLI